jgi:hypothetical protein
MRKLVPALATLLVLSACITSRFVPVIDPSPYPHRPANYPIELISGVPARTYIALGHVSATGCAACSSTSVANKVRRKVREAGGDAVIRMETYVAPAGTVGAGGVTIQGTAVRWKD